MEIFRSDIRESMVSPPSSFEWLRNNCVKFLTTEHPSPKKSNFNVIFIVA
jgi:hypothetical protein